MFNIPNYTVTSMFEDTHMFILFMYIYIYIGGGSMQGLAEQISSQAPRDPGCMCVCIYIYIYIYMLN